jgi:hypothetical protein
VPVVTGEFAEDNYLAAGCNATPGSSTFDENYMNWADSNGVSYLAWVWLVDDPPQPNDDPCDRHGLLSSYAGTPLAPNGTAVHDHLAALASATTTSTTTSTTTTTTTAGTTPPGNTKTARPSLNRFTAHLTGVKKLTFALRSKQACSGTLTIQTASLYVAPAVARRHRVHVKLGTVHFKLKANKAKTVTVPLKRVTQRFVKSHRTLRVVVTVSLSSSAGKRVTHRTITLHHR